MNNKGFMMAEVIVVASIILLSLTGFFTLYTKAISEYNTRISYNDVKTLYELADYRNKNTFSFSTATTSYEPLTSPSGTKIILLKYNIFSTNDYESLVRNGGLNKTFNDYIMYLAEAEKFREGAHILVMEKCKTDKTDCKYAYLETAVK